MTHSDLRPCCRPRIAPSDKRSSDGTSTLKTVNSYKPRAKAVRHHRKSPWAEHQPARSLLTLGDGETEGKQPGRRGVKTACTRGGMTLRVLDCPLHSVPQTGQLPKALRLPAGKSPLGDNSIRPATSLQVKMERQEHVSRLHPSGAGAACECSGE